MGKYAVDRTEAVDEGTVNIIRDDDQIRIFLHHLFQLIQSLIGKSVGSGVGGIDQEKGFYRWILQLLKFAVLNIPVVFHGGAHIDGNEVVAFDRRNLQIGCKDRCGDRNPVSRFQQPVVPERVKNVVYGGSSALCGEDLCR